VPIVYLERAMKKCHGLHAFSALLSVGSGVRAIIGSKHRPCNFTEKGAIRGIC